MNRWISLTVFIFYYFSQAILGLDRDLQITGSDSNRENPVWINDRVTITSEFLIFIWSFNNSTIAEWNLGGFYTYPNTSILTNIEADSGEADSHIILRNVTHTYTGIYTAKDDLNLDRYYSLNVRVHEVNLSSIEFSLSNDSNSCKARLLINDSINPPNFNISRMVNSADLIFNTINPSNTTIFEIIGSQLNIANNSRNITIDIQYTFIDNNFSTVVFKNELLNTSIISQPTVTIVGPTDNRTVIIQHETNVQCVHNITYCLNTTNTEPQCNYSSNLNNISLEYPWNSTFANLSITYDIIYAKYHFDINVTQNTAEATTIEPTTMNTSPPEITTTQSGTNDNTTTSEGTTDHSDRTYSSISPSLFSIDLDTAASPSVTVSFEYQNTTSFPTNNTTRPPDNSEPLAGWKIALIIIGSIIAVVLIFGIIGFCLWKKKSKKTYKPARPLQVQPISTEHIVQKPVLRSEPTNRLQVHHDQRRQNPQSPSYDSAIRPTIPQPIPRSYELSNGQQARHSRPLQHEHVPQSSGSLSTSPWLEFTDQSQVSRGRHGRLPPISND